MYNPAPNSKTTLKCFTSITMNMKEDNYCLHLVFTETFHLLCCCPVSHPLNHPPPIFLSNTSPLHKATTRSFCQGRRHCCCSTWRFHQSCQTGACWSSRADLQPEGAAHQPPTPQRYTLPAPSSDRQLSGGCWNLVQHCGRTSWQGWSPGCQPTAGRPQTPGWSWAWRLRSAHRWWSQHRRTGSGGWGSWSCSWWWSRHGQPARQKATPAGSRSSCTAAGRYSAPHRSSTGPPDCSAHTDRQKEKGSVIANIIHNQCNVMQDIY